MLPIGARNQSVIIVSLGKFKILYLVHLFLCTLQSYFALQFRKKSFKYVCLRKQDEIETWSRFSFSSCVSSSENVWKLGGGNGPVLWLVY